MSATARILIVDASRESREVLRTLLERAGNVALETPRASQATEIIRQKQPHLVVYDTTADPSPSQQSTQALGRCAARNKTPIVVLGTTKRPFSPLPTGQWVAKPYHYAPLIRKIEELLEGQLKAGA